MYLLFLNFLFLTGASPLGEAPLISIPGHKNLGTTPIPDLGPTLRYYCGYLLPDSNIIRGGLLSKDLENSRFFEGFTVILDGTVRRECDTRGGKQELGKLAKFAAIGRIGLEESPEFSEADESIKRDDAIITSALKRNAILLTDDQNMKAVAQAKGIFLLSTR